jgi:hypothetical protein
MQKINGHKKINYTLIAVIFFSLIWLYIYYVNGFFKTGFNYFINDYLIFPEYNHVTNIFDILYRSTIGNDELPQQRFFPLYIFFKKIAPHIFGLNPITYYLFTLILAIVTNLNFYLFARYLKFSFYESILFSLFILIGNQSIAYSYIFPFPAESSATFFVSLAFIFAIQNSQIKHRVFIYNSLFLIFSLLPAFDKESYILLIPSLIFLKIWLFVHQKNISIVSSIKKNKFILSILSIFFIALILWIKLRVTGKFYAGFDNTTFSIAHSLDLLKFLFTHTIFPYTILVNLIYTFFKKNNTDKVENIYICVFSFLILIPQFLLYTKSGMEGNYHYLLPTTIGLSLLLIYPLSKLKNSINLGYKILLSLTCILLVIQFNITQNLFKAKGQYLSDLNSMVNNLTSCLHKKDSTLVIFANPYMQYEPLIGLKTSVLDNILHLDKNHINLITYGSLDSDFKSNVFKEFEVNLHSQIGSTRKDIDYNYKNDRPDRFSNEFLNKADTILIFNYPEFKSDFINKSKSWFSPSNYSFNMFNTIDSAIYCKKN